MASRKYVTALTLLVIACLIHNIAAEDKSSDNLASCEKNLKTIKNELTKIFGSDPATIKKNVKGVLSILVKDVPIVEEDIQKILELVEKDVPNNKEDFKKLWSKLKQINVPASEGSLKKILHKLEETDVPINEENLPDFLKMLNGITSESGLSLCDLVKTIIQTPDDEA